MDFSAEIPYLLLDALDVVLAGAASLQPLAVGERKIPAVFFRREHIAVIRHVRVRRDAFDVALHGIDAGIGCRGGLQDRELQGGEILVGRNLLPALVRILRLLERCAGGFHHGGDCGAVATIDLAFFLHSIQCIVEIDLPFRDCVDIVVAGVADVGIARFDDIARGERAGLGQNGFEFREIAEDTRKEQRFKTYALAVGSARSRLGKRRSARPGPVSASVLMALKAA